MRRSEKKRGRLEGGGGEDVRELMEKTQRRPNGGRGGGGKWKMRVEAISSRDGNGRMGQMKRTGKEVLRDRMIERERNRMMASERENNMMRETE